MMFWHLKLQYREEEGEICNVEYFFEDEEQAIVCALDYKKYGEILHIDIERKYTAVFRKEYTLNKKGDK